MPLLRSLAGRRGGRYYKHGAPNGAFRIAATDPPPCGKSVQNAGTCSRCRTSRVIKSGSKLHALHALRETRTCTEQNSSSSLLPEIRLQTERAWRTAGKGSVFWKSRRGLLS